MEAKDYYTTAYEIESKDPKRSLLYYLLSHRKGEAYDNRSYRIAILYYTIKKYRKSIKWIRSSIADCPHGVSYLLLSKSLIHMHDWRNAVEALNDAKLFGANLDQVNTLRALCYLYLEDWETLRLTLAELSKDTTLMRTIISIYDAKHDLARQVESISNLDRDSLNIVRLYLEDKQAAVSRIIAKHVK